MQLVVATTPVLAALASAVAPSAPADADGPYLPSMSAAESAVRPRLVVSYSSPTGPAR